MRRRPGPGINRSFHHFIGDTGIATGDGVRDRRAFEGSRMRLERFPGPPVRASGVIPARVGFERIGHRPAMDDHYYAERLLTVCRCGGSRFKVPAHDVRAGVVWYCGSRCATRRPLSVADGRGIRVAPYRAETVEAA